MIGTAENASLAATRPSSHILSFDGTSREVYLIEGVVYKVPIGWYRDNEAEHLNLTRLKGKDIPAGIAFPEASLHGDILAMEYIKGIPTGSCIDCEVGDPCQYGDCMPIDIAEAFRILGFIDLSFGNVIIKDGIYYLIDVVS